MPRVLHLSASFPRSATDNVAPFLLDLLRVQRDAGWDVAAVAVHDEGLPAAHVIDGIPVRRVRYGPSRWEVLAYRGGGHGGLRSPAHAGLLPGLGAGLLAALASEVRRTGAGVVHAHWILPGGIVLASLPRRLGGRRVLTMHGTDVELAAGRLNPLVRRIVGRMDALLAVSEPLARRAEAVLGLEHGAVGVARLPLPPGLHATPLPDTDPPTLLAAGRASREKGFDVLVAAMALPAAARWRATIVADGPERAALERAAGDRVSFLPLQPREALFDLVRGAHAVVIPSRTEGLGMFAVEALALGRPVVASAVGGLTEVVVPGDDGVLVPAEDPGALAEAIGSLPLRPPVATAAHRHGPEEVAAAHAAAYGLAP